MAKNLFSGAAFIKAPCSSPGHCRISGHRSSPGHVWYGILWYLMTPLHGIACFYDVGFGARAVSRKTPIYFMQVYFWEIGHTVRLVNPHIPTFHFLKISTFAFFTPPYWAVVSLRNCIFSRLEPLPCECGPFNHYSGRSGWEGGLTT